MLYVRFEKGRAIEALETEAVRTLGNLAERQEMRGMGALQCRCDWRDMATAERIAEELNASPFAKGRVYMAVDEGSNVSPRYDVVEAPKKGDDVSRGFNGDYYPCGKIVSISSDRRVIRARDDKGNERRFYRRGMSSTWLNERTWGLVPGVRDERNPSF